jgi:hypothetical protein
MRRVNPPKDKAWRAGRVPCPDLSGADPLGGLKLFNPAVHTLHIYISGETNGKMFVL